MRNAGIPDDADHAGARCSETLAVDICLRKSPALAGTGSPRVRLGLAAEDLTAMRRHKD